MSRLNKKRFHRKPLALPYSTPPRSGPVHFDETLRTAAQLVDTPHTTAA
jgi:hypothetical protein